VLPGTPGTIVRDFSDPANIDILDNTTLVTNGPGGIITNTSLDGGNFSSHGWILASSAPAGARGILSTGDPTHWVLYSYPFGQGTVIYSPIPLDFYLGGFGGIFTNMQNYAANVVAYANSIR
jgi:large repetitive protein